MNASRIFILIAGLVAGPLTAVAVPVTWEAQGSVDTSTIPPAFFASFIPELVGTQPEDELVLRITFDPDAALIRETPNDAGGRTFSFDAVSLKLELEVPRLGLGTHVFTVDNPIPGAAVLPQLLIRDDFVDPTSRIFDGLQFGHQYLTESGVFAFSVTAVFSNIDTNILNGGSLPLSPDPRLREGFEHGISIIASGNGSLFGPLSSLVRLPTTIPEPGSLALFCLGLSALRVATRRGARRHA